MGRHFDSNVLRFRMVSRQLQATDPNTGGKLDVANLGWVRPPLVYLASIMAGALLTWLLPLPVALPAAVPIGGTMVFASILLFLFSVRALRAAGTRVRGNQPTANIVRTWPYRQAGRRRAQRRGGLRRHAAKRLEQQERKLIWQGFA